MAHVLFENTTAVVQLDPDATAQFACGDYPTAQFACDDYPTEQTPALTLEQPLFDEPLPVPVVSEPAYVVEVRAPHGSPRLLAVRDTLEDAARIANGIHPGVADVVVHEVALPCDAAALAEALRNSRSWTRAPNGTWFPELP